jgi:hypothetical protein
MRGFIFPIENSWIFVPLSVGAMALSENRAPPFVITRQNLPIATLRHRGMNVPNPQSGQ